MKQLSALGEICSNAKQDQKEQCIHILILFQICSLHFICGHSFLIKSYLTYQLLSYQAATSAPIEKKSHGEKMLKQHRSDNDQPLPTTQPCKTE